VTVRELEKSVRISDSSIVSILRNHLGMRKVSARWVPHHLNPNQMRARVEFSSFMLEKFDAGASKLVDNIITGDETWVYFYDPETKEQSRQWIAREEDAPVKFRRVRSVGKVLAIGFSLLVRAAQWMPNKQINTRKQTNKH
jgi:histone-lysine N-methyltransferase SETMAR